PEKKDEASQKTGNILSQILSDTGNVDDNASASISYTETRTGPDYDNILTSTPHTEGPFVLGRSLTPIVGNNSTRNLENSSTKPDDDSNRRTSTPIRAPTPIRASTPITPMQIDDEHCNFEEHMEYREALEKYFAEHASHYIENLGRNTWISLFESKLLPEELAEKEDSEQSPEISSIIEELSDADDGNSSSYEELLKSLDSKFS
ncbi:hypothetical protein GLOIN_2v1783064, partial [Rhizophagus irregularis DAOM 181602=DAOM 197198]